MVRGSLVLKSGPRRAVHVDLAGDARRVTKRFRARGLPHLLDGRRARAEERALARLAALGLPVPGPVRVARGAGGAWLLEMPWVGERTLARHLAERGGGPARADAQRLAELAARLVALGVRHGDPHPHNALVDDRGELWLVDASSVRFLAPPAPGDAARLAEELARLCAPLRELVPARGRARLLAMLLRALPAELARGVDRCALARAVERSARALRRAAVEANLDRWERESGVCAADGRTVRRRAPAPWGETETIALAGPPRALAAAWRSAARLAEHGVPAALPLELRRGTRAAFEVPRGARPLEDALAAGADAAPLARAAGALLGAARDRGLVLSLPPRGGLLAAPDGAVLAAAPGGARARGSSAAGGDVLAEARRNAGLAELVARAPADLARGFAGALPRHERPEHDGSAADGRGERESRRA